MASVVLTATLPSMRKDGSDLALGDISSVTFLRDIGQGQGPMTTVTGPFSSNIVAFTDTSPAVGSDVYAFFCTDVNGLVGDTCPPVTVTVAAPVSTSPPAAGTLTAVVQA